MMALDILDEDKLFDRNRRQGYEVTKRKREGEIFVHSVFPGPNNWGGTSSWPMTILNALEECYFILKLPGDFIGLTEAVITILPDATETIQWDIEIQAAAKNENEYDVNRKNNDLNVQKAVTQNIITELDLMASTTGNPNGLFPKILKAGDYLGVLFQSDTENIQVLGLRIKYKTQ